MLVGVLSEWNFAFSASGLPWSEVVRGGPLWISGRPGGWRTNVAI